MMPDQEISLAPPASASPAGASGSLLKRLWRLVPIAHRRRIYRASNWTGLPYVLGFLATYNEKHQAANFAGNLVRLKEDYAASLNERRRRLARRLDAIIDALVLPNGVCKTTYPKRQNVVLDQILHDPQCRPGGDAIRVLDVPASTGIASLASLERLRRDFQVTRYVLGDLSFQVLYDPDRGCVFDEDGRLLQVRGRHRFFSIYRAHAAGNDFSPLTRLLLLPWTLWSWYLQQHYAFSATGDLVPIPLTHPDIEALLAEGMVELARVNVFEDIPGEYDLILSFNLLQRNYFPPDMIARGMERLGAALSENGVLVVGSPDPDSCGLNAHLVARKQGGRLVIVKQTAEF